MRGSLGMSTALAPEDRTSAVLVRLLHHSMTLHGLAPGPWDDTGATTALQNKRRLAEQALAQAGPAPLLRVGEALPALAHAPLVMALVAAEDGVGVLTRWTRLARYFHLRYPAQVVALGPGHARIAHPGAPNDPPGPALNLLLAGAMAGLLRWQGQAQVRLAFGPEATPALDHDRVVLTQLPPCLETNVWQLDWQPTPSQPPALRPSRGPALVERIRQVISRDLLRPWTVATLAHQVGLSPRSLQRHLAQANTSLTSLRHQCRLEAATAQVLTTTTPLADIGFLCGFADSAHFHRTFKSSTGLTPRQMRGVEESVASP